MPCLFLSVPLFHGFLPYDLSLWSVLEACLSNMTVGEFPIDSVFNVTMQRNFSASVHMQ